MRGTKLALAIVMATLVAMPAAATSVPWANGGFEAGEATWTLADATTVTDADDDGDQEALLQGSGDGTFQIARGSTKGPMPATTPLSFAIEEGAFDYNIRMVLVDAKDPQPYLNNLFFLDPTGTVEPDWFDDQILIWNSEGALSGEQVLDPLEADAANIDGWQQMSEDERRQELATYVHASMVVYGVAEGYDGGATLDDFAWET